MKDNGYYVGFIGKYGVGNYLPQKEFDYWRGLRDKEHIIKKIRMAIPGI